jgi:hypothetical protein
MDPLAVENIKMVFRECLATKAAMFDIGAKFFWGALRGV